MPKCPTNDMYVFHQRLHQVLHQDSSLFDRKVKHHFYFCLLINGANYLICINRRDWEILSCLGRLVKRNCLALYLVYVKPILYCCSCVCIIYICFVIYHQTFHRLCVSLKLYTTQGSRLFYVTRSSQRGSSY